MTSNPSAQDSGQAPEVSIVIPHYGDPGPTRTLVEALHAQVGAPALEVIVSDDASPEPFPETEGALVVRRTRNGGFGSAVNSGAAQARGDLLLILNSDVELTPEFVAELVAAARPWMPAVVSPRIVTPDGRYEWVGRRYPRVSHQVVEWLTPLARYRDTPRWHRAVGHDLAADAEATVPTDWVVGAAMLMPRADFEAVGGFDERFFMNAEEVDLQVRLRERGLPSLVIGEVTLVHESGGSSDPERRRAWLVDSRLEYARKWGGRTALLAALGGATAVNAGWNTVRRARGVDVQPLRVARQELALLRRRGSN